MGVMNQYPWMMPPQANAGGALGAAQFPFMAPSAFQQLQQQMAALQQSQAQIGQFQQNPLGTPPQMQMPAQAPGPRPQQVANQQAPQPTVTPIQTPQVGQRQPPQANRTMQSAMPMPSQQGPQQPFAMQNQANAFMPMPDQQQGQQAPQVATEEEAGNWLDDFLGRFTGEGAEDNDQLTVSERMSPFLAMIEAGTPSWDADRETWGAVADSMTTMADRRRALSDRAEDRGFQTEQRDQWRREQERSSQQRQRWEQAVQAAPDEQTRQQLLAIGPDDYAQVLLNREQREFQRSEGALDRQNQVRVAGMSAGRQNYDDLRQDNRLAASVGNSFADDNRVFTAQRDAFTRLATLAQNGQDGSIAFIYAYMKALDPTSTIRESEFDIAQQIGGFGDQAVAAFERVRNGERLTPQQRDAMLETARRTYVAGAQQFRENQRRQQQMIEMFGFNPEQRRAANPELRLSEQQWDNTLPANDPRRYDVYRARQRTEGAGQGAQQRDFSTMTEQQITALDVSTLSPQERAAVRRRIDELEGNQVPTFMNIPLPGLRHR